MAMMNAYAQYSNSRILTASPAELVLMLYEGAIKFGNIAILAIEQRDIQKAHTNIIKVQRIIDNFRATLDMNYDVAQDFDRVYAYLQGRIIDANVHKDVVIMNEIIGHLRTMRDTWKEVMRKAR